MTEEKKIDQEVAAQSPEYGASSIKVIEGLEAVRKRPAMYIGSTGPQGLHHLVYEIVDNSVDEALAGHCDTINIILHTDGSCSVEDNGRGIPTEIHPTEGVSAAEVALTKLHAGGKFDKDSYKYSGGLHGVGVSVVNALSTSLALEIYRSNQVYSQLYAKGKPLNSLHVIGETKKRGTYVRFSPDPEIFKDTVTFNFDLLSARLRELAFLNRGLRITIEEEQTQKSHDFFFEGGIVSFVEHINSKKTPLFPETIYGFKEEESYILECAIQYNDGYGEQLFSFVNNINTVEGGTHVAGFKGALTKACNKRAQEYSMTKDQESFSSEDVREGLVCVLNIKIAEAQFEGQTKTKLGNSEVKGIVESWAFGVLDSYFEEHPSIAKKILQKAHIALQAREAARKARELTRRKTALDTVVLPGKLTDCSNESPADSELFIVEGESAGGTARQGRDRFSQAILPLKGKILNVEKARFDKILSNEEIRALITAIGAGVGDADFNIEKARYHKIILMTDADVDGAHIRTLLLTLFFRYMRPLIDKGYLYLAQPPLYKAKIGKKEEYLKDERSFKKFLFDWVKDHGVLAVENSLLEGEALATLLDCLLRYNSQLEETAHAFKLAYSTCSELITALRSMDQSDTENPTSVLAALHRLMPHYETSLKEGKLNEQSIPKTMVTFKMRNDEWSVNVDFFTSPETRKLLAKMEELTLLERPWKLTIKDKDKSIEGTTILQLINAITKISKPHMTVQRYKGLGEMNADQLYETAMDASKRTLIQITIGDALEADAWFDSLMGSEAAGRREFIEENGRFVKNLDV
ncbi:DNA topoisomerase (ATP-hydrolyzing) subunit B [Candidatus Dependentiae bacterium]|nr:DNA topoisomerase (ATP-hydrolyzing) subunit B [Candidatus Dependentiae bacterium]